MSKEKEPWSPGDSRRAEDEDPFEPVRRRADDDEIRAERRVTDDAGERRKGMPLFLKVIGFAFAGV
ncbi:MAG: hypothetical protein RIE56_09335, partial [Amphiplicatus sp.]